MIRGIMVYSHDLDDGLNEKLTRIKKLGFNSIFYVTKNYDGKVFYQSSIADVEKDALSKICEVCDTLSIKVFSWFCLFSEGYTGELDAEGISKFLQKNPYVAAKDKIGRTTLSHPVPSDYGFENYVCPLNERVQTYEINLMIEILKKYTISGIHLDFVRYPWPGQYCYCDYCEKAYWETYGEKLNEISIEKHQSWKEQVITKFVSRVYKELQEIRKDATVSALVWKYPEGLSKNQNWKEWDTDFVTPMFQHRLYIRTAKWIKREIKRNVSMSRKQFIPAIGGINSSVITLRKWREILDVIYSVGLEDFLIMHYDLDGVLNTLEGETASEFLNKLLKGGFFVFRHLLRRITI